MPLTETIDARVERLLARLSVGVRLSLEDATWLCLELRRAREALRNSLDNYDDVSVKLYFGKDGTT